MQGFILFFSSFFSLRPSFYPSGVLREFLHGGSSRILFILHLFFKFSLEVMIRQAILSNKHGAQHMFCFEEFKPSSSCIPKFNYFYLIFWVVLCHSWQFEFVFRDSTVVKNEIVKPINFLRAGALFNPSISSLELSWVIFHLKPSLRNVAIVVLNQ